MAASRTDLPPPGPDGAEPVARAMWRLFEPVHAVVYFADEAAAAFAAAGLRGFWMGYFAGRAAPMGAVGPAVVHATFFTFHPARVARALPDAWAFAPPERVLEARLAGAGAALARVLAGADRAELARAAELGRGALEGLATEGRPLGAANAALPWPSDPVAALWQAATVLREHRGDGHLAALVAAGLDGRGALVSMAATGAVPRAMLQAARGWDDGEWDEAAAVLEARGWIHPDGTATAAGAAARDEIEAVTDRLAAAPWERLGPSGTAELRALLAPWARAVAGAGVVPVPNPIGLPPPG
ncbi:MAG TPA: hypothetical protein VMB72_01090 [Acidimicrobiales bacterium]|nr:hypothetical protein [Acidimicrobiales bacterium]